MQLLLGKKEGFQGALRAKRCIAQHIMVLPSAKRLTCKQQNASEIACSKTSSFNLQGQARCARTYPD
jgi:hypothetical protein